MSAPMREVAHRVFAREFNDATFTFKESEEERAPLYLLLPTGAKANRVFVAGTLTETEDVGGDGEYWRGRVIDPTGTFFVYAGQYQPQPASVLRDIDTPAYVSVVGKPRTYETDDGSVNVSIRPESLAPIDVGTRDRWVAETAERSLDRIAAFEEETNEAAAMAREEYDASITTYRDIVIEALESLEEQSQPTAAAD